MSKPNTVDLFAPPEYWDLTEEERKYFRCGPGRGILERLVPETAYGLRLSAACSIHDFMYRYGFTDQDKVDADEVFLNNMIRIIEVKTSSKILMFLRLRRARTYYLAVKLFGGPAFWNGKNKNEEMEKINV
jgi:hypothetical protein